jgi:pSer/pThr/pTyr-binding forkhead associated (FHA) protein
MADPHEELKTKEEEVEGFMSISLDDLAQELREHGVGAFREKYTCPFLILTYNPQASTEGIEVLTAKTSSYDVQQATRRPVEHTKGMRAAAVYKSDRNLFESKVTVGRAKNNDIIIRERKISKLHSQFIPGDESHQLVDMGSSNGTVVNGIKLKEGKPHGLKSGDRIAVWRYIFEFVEPEELIKLLLKTYWPPALRPRMGRRK